MTKTLRSTLLAVVALVAALGMLNGCKDSNTETTAAARTQSQPTYRAPAGPKLSSGSTIQVVLGNAISSETAHQGDSWHGTIAENVVGTNGVVIPAGSPVTGVVTAVIPAKKGSRAMLDLAVRSIQVNGRSQAVTANAGEIVAGSTRARNLGVIAGGAAAGAVVGNNVGDHNHTALGALIGGATAAGVVSKTRGYQVELKDGTVMSFTVSESVSMR